MNIPLVDLHTQYTQLKKEIDTAISAVISTSQFVSGPVVKEFEDKFADFCGTGYCVGVSSGTDALYLALRAAGISSDDEVITVSNTFIATTEAISLTGAKPVFVDVDPCFYNIDVDLIEEKITLATKAIIVVHLFGQPCNMDKINILASKHKLLVIEDAAQAHGAEYSGTRVGGLADIGCFSFYPGKNLGAYGDAGAVVTDNPEIAKKVRLLRNHGRADKYLHEIEGVNSRMDGIQAAVLNVKLSYLDKWNMARNHGAGKYRKLLSGIESIVLPNVSQNVKHVYHLFVIRVKERDDVLRRLAQKGVAAGIHYPVPLHIQKAYSYLGYSPGDFPVSEVLANDILSLPLYPEMTDDQIEYVANCLRNICGEE